MMSYATVFTILCLLSGIQIHAQGSSSAAASAGASQALTATTQVTVSINPNLPQTALATGYSIPALSELTSGAPADPTTALDTTATQGQQPTAVSNAPALPNPTLVIANYPALDVTPSVNSSQVQQWLSQIDMSKVPTYGQTDGTCAGTPGAITDGRCWWTCGGCTRDTDITECPDQYTWGLSFDDGPSPYTPLLLDYLNQQNVKTTFFVVGSRVLSRPEMVQAEYISGHQLSVHTWSHPYLTKLTNEEIVAELGWTKQVIKDVVGVTPNTFRPPYGDIDDRVRAIAAQMGLTPIIWSAVSANGTVTNFDTTDWNIPGGTANGESALEKFELILQTYVPLLSTGFIVLAHDLYQQSIDLAVGYVLPMAISSGKFKLQSIIECLGKPMSEAYIETSSNNTQTQVTSAATTFFQAIDGSQTASAASTTSAAAVAGSSMSGSASSAAASGSTGSTGSQTGSASASGSGASAKSGAGHSYSPAAMLVALVIVALGMVLMA